MLATKMHLNSWMRKKLKNVNDLNCFYTCVGKSNGILHAMAPDESSGAAIKIDKKTNLLVASIVVLAKLFTCVYCCDAKCPTTFLVDPYFAVR